MKAEIVEIRTLDELAPRRIDPRQFGAAGAGEDGILAAHLATVRLPSAKNGERFDIQWNAPCLPALGGLTLHGEPFSVGVDVPPRQVEQFSAPQPSVQRQQYDRPQMIDELGRSQREQRIATYRAPFIEAHPASAQLLLPRQQRRAQLFFLHVAQVT